jgi:hypothetical protein
MRSDVEFSTASYVKQEQVHIKICCGKFFLKKKFNCTLFEEKHRNRMFMGRIFSIEITYDIYKYRALVSVFVLNDGRPFFHIQLIDSFLKEIFQVEHIRYRGTNGYQYCDLYNDDLSTVLIDRIAQAIEQKLSGRSALIRSLPGTRRQIKT